MLVYAWLSLQKMFYISLITIKFPHMVLLAKVAKLTKGEVEKKRRKQEFLCKGQKTGSDTQVSFINCSDIYMVKPTEN